MICELGCENDCLDLPSLSIIRCNSINDFIHQYMGHVILESMIYYYYIWIDIPNLTESNIHYGKFSFHYTADLQARSTCVSVIYCVDADGLRNYIVHHSVNVVIQEEMSSNECYYIRNNQSVSDIPSEIQNLHIYAYRNRYERISFSYFFINLKTIITGDECFHNVYEFVIDCLPNLEIIFIGKKCFQQNTLRDEKKCRITNCPYLRRLVIFDHSFEFFNNLELSNVNSLKYIYFGDYCFRRADLVLKGKWARERERLDGLDLPSLETVIFGGAAFIDYHFAQFESTWWLFIIISRSRPSQITYH